MEAKLGGRVKEFVNRQTLHLDGDVCMKAFCRVSHKTKSFNTFFSGVMKGLEEYGIGMIFQKAVTASSQRL